MNTSLSKILPTNNGNKWIKEEEKLLLDKLDIDIDIKTIAETHKRTIGAINSRRKKIAYDMFLKKKNIEYIIKKTRLDEECINYTIKRRQKISSKKNKQSILTFQEFKSKVQNNSLESNIENNIHNKKLVIDDSISHLENLIKLDNKFNTTLKYLNKDKKPLPKSLSKKIIKEAKDITYFNYLKLMPRRRIEGTSNTSLKLYNSDGHEYKKLPIPEVSIAEAHDKFVSILGILKKQEERIAQLERM